MRSGQPGETQHLRRQTAIPAARLGTSRSVSGADLCAARVSGTGTAAWWGKEKGFPLGFPVGFPVFIANVKAEGD